VAVANESDRQIALIATSRKRERRASTTSDDEDDMAESASRARFKDPRWEFTDAVQQSDLEPPTRHVLLALALADATLKPFVSQETLAKRTGFNRKTIEAHIAAAVAANWLTITNRTKESKSRPRREGRYAGNKYELHVPRGDAHHGNETPMVAGADHGNETPMAEVDHGNKTPMVSLPRHGNLTPSPREPDGLHHGNEVPTNYKREDKKLTRGCARDAERRAPTRVAAGQPMTITPRDVLPWREWTGWLERPAQGRKGRAILERAEREKRMVVEFPAPGFVPKGQQVPWPIVPDECLAEELPTTGDRDDAAPERERVTCGEASP
jgi:hypothetical protein